MDESLVGVVPEEGMALVSVLDDALLAHHGAGTKLEDKPLDDVDMDMDIDVDVFRPSAMLDTRLDEEFGSARGFSGLWCTDGAEHGHVDLEHMLLSESDEELLGLIKQEQAAEHAGLLCDPLRRRVFAIRAGRIAADGAIDAAQFPPKYNSHTAVKAASGRSVFRHTFGGRSQRFGFATSSDAVNGVTVRQKAPLAAADAERVPPVVAAAAEVPQDGTSGYEAASLEQTSANKEDEDVDMEVDAAAATPLVAVALSPRCSPTASSITIKQEIIKEEPVVFKHEPFDPTPVTPVRPQPVPTGRHADPPLFASPDTTATSLPAREETFHTPLRRSMSSPASSAFSSPTPCGIGKTSFVSLDRMAAIGAAGNVHHYHSSSENDLLHTPQFRSMSPADELEKVAALHDHDTLGKLDKVENASSPSAAQTGDHDERTTDGREQKKSAQNLEGSGDRASIALVVAGSPATPLPPRYIKGPTDTEKRRVHSSTFQSFARSFSFSSAPSTSSSALD